MLKLLASFLLFLALNCGRSCKGINFASFSPTQAPSIPSFHPTEAPAIAPSAGSFPPTQAPAVVPSLPPPLPTPSPPPPPPKPVPLQQDVDAINALLSLSWTPGAVYRPFFSPDDCQTYKWPGIWCNCWMNPCGVTFIQLRGQNLRGRIPREIGHLTYLTSLDLSSNKLSGPIPHSITKLSQLSVLKLGGNNFEGPIPGFLAEMKSLQSLDLGDNSFNGLIPSEFRSFPSLKYLYLGNNLLNDSIPYELGQISSLITLDLHDNNLWGQLPEQLGNLKYLENVDLSNNYLNGTLPSSFQNLTSLYNFNIRGNNFSGKVPEFISHWKNLGKLTLLGNNFSGPPLPTAITALTDLTYLSITDLAREGTNFSIPEELNNSVSWEILILRNCSLVGPIPAFIWNLSSLTYLDLSFNNLSGGIPTNVDPGILRNLDSVFLRRNNLSGTLPEWLTNLSISNVDVSENFFTNVAFTAKESSKLNLFSCCNASKLQKQWQHPNYYCFDQSTTYDHLYINCGGNVTRSNGNNYEDDLQSNGASTFFLSNNSAWAYSSMGTFLDTNQKNYTLNQTCDMNMDDAPLYMDARISPISLKYYGFCLKNVKYNLKLHFAEIGLPANKTSTKRRRVFDIVIQGGQHYLKDFNIEAEAGGVNKNVTKNFTITVSDGRLEVHLYWSGKGSTPTRYYGPLISAISLSPVLKKHPKLSSVTIGWIAGSTTIFVVLMLAIFWKLGWLDKKTSKDEEFRAFELFPGEVMNFQQIKAATKNFDPSKKIGEGGFGAVYKGVLSDDTQIAVKRISAKSKAGGQKFMNEIVTIYALQHPNLVSLKGCCAKDNELLLIHEYMEKGSLEHALFEPSEEKSNLNWLRRVRICLDVAKGLEFLHEKVSKRQIIHRDIKPTNILLDKDFNAKISDFGYADFNAEENTRKRENIKGTSVYMAPEYIAQGILTPKADVYSFGIVMLEIISGKKICTYRGKDQTVYLLELAYEYKRQGNLIALLDGNLGSDYTYNEVVKVLDLAMECVSIAGTLRPAMSKIVKVLEGVVQVEESKKKLENKSLRKNSSAEPKIVACPVAASSQSAQSGSSSQEGAISCSSSKEIDDLTTSAD